MLVFFKWYLVLLMVNHATALRIYAATLGHHGNTFFIDERNDDDDDDAAAAAAAAAAPGDRRNTRNRNSKPLLG